MMSKPVVTKCLKNGVRTPNASWGQLVTALNNIQMTTAADAISKQYKIGKDCYVASSLASYMSMMH